MPPPPIEDYEDSELNRSNPYTMADDFSILKVVGSYFGTTFHGKIPWSFWQTYKKVTGSTRSTSSLYHHWNGAIKKKYDAFLSTGRLSDCILWLETAVMTQDTPQLFTMPAGTPLKHYGSEPPVPLDPNPQPRADQPSALIRMSSMSTNPPTQFFFPK
jgi:hypothetical protein